MYSDEIEATMVGLILRAAATVLFILSALHFGLLWFVLGRNRRGYSY